MGKLIWCLKQLLPLTYRTTYVQNGKSHFTVWNMWFGKCFNVDDYVYYDSQKDIDGKPWPDLVLGDIDASVITAGVMPSLTRSNDMKYKKKPVVIEAVQWNGELLLFNVPRWLTDAQASEVIKFMSDDKAIIKTLEGDMILSVGDYIIRGIKGEIYPCKPDIFEITYEKV